MSILIMLNSISEIRKNKIDIGSKDKEAFKAMTLEEGDFVLNEYFYRVQFNSPNIHLKEWLQSVKFVCDAASNYDRD